MAPQILRAPSFTYHLVKELKTNLYNVESRSYNVPTSNYVARGKLWSIVEVLRYTMFRDLFQSMIKFNTRYNAIVLPRYLRHSGTLLI